jgi:phosphoenolpyruvate carboxykinase (ATP)
LTAEQAMFHFLNGYTCKLAGTEMGVTEPELTFSTCFGQPFLPLPPAVYAKLLGEKIERHQVQVWLVNTGWTGGKFGTGHRIKLAHTRALLHAAFSGSLLDEGLVEEPFFGLKIPVSCPEVPSEILSPVRTWADADEYAQAAATLRAKFEHNFEKYG